VGVQEDVCAVEMDVGEQATATELTVVVTDGLPLPQPITGITPKEIPRESRRIVASLFI
jgi:hypothetical protein